MGRSLTLRVSVLENCQLQCAYCLPKKNIDSVGKKSWLTPGQYQVIAKTLTSLPVKKIRFTGGEPLLRAELPAIIEAFSRQHPHAPCALTTNGLRYLSIAKKLKKSGLQGLTFHLDTLRPERYQKIMGPGDVETVRNAIKIAQELGHKCKINMVVQKSLNDDELIDFIYFSHELGVEVRFIELMNTGSARLFVRDHFISGQEILQIISEKFSLKEVPRESQSAPAERFLIDKLSLNFGLIASDTRPFCQDCDRVRLSADGKIRTCLYENSGLDLELAKNPKPEVILARIVKKLVDKSSFHPMNKKKRRIFSMSQTGG